MPVERERSIIVKPSKLANRPISRWAQLPIDPICQDMRTGDADLHPVAGPGAPQNDLAQLVSFGVQV